MTEKFMGYDEETFARVVALKTFSVYETQTGQITHLFQHEDQAWLKARDLNDARAAAEGLRYSVKRTDRKTEARRVERVKRYQAIMLRAWRGVVRNEDAILREAVRICHSRSTKGKRARSIYGKEYELMTLQSAQRIVAERAERKAVTS
jgi:hypothetical protein